MAQSIGIIISTLVFLQPSDTWGRLPVMHVTNILFLASRVIMLFVYDNYYALLIVTAMGSGFFPIGVRNGWTAGEQLLPCQG
jgi:MFS family permease